MEELIKQFGDRIQKQKDLSPYFTLRAKTSAEYYIEAESREDIIKAVTITAKHGIPLFILGGGSNTIVLKDMIHGLVLRNRYMKMEILTEEKEYAEVLFSSGYPMSRVVNETVKKGFEGFEYHLGLPGTLGGGIYMNSKWTKNLSYIGDNLISATLVDQEGNEKKVDREYFQFTYDFSILQKTGEIVLEAVFKLMKEDPAVLEKRSKDALAYRKETQPFGVATGGCFFQNISDEEKEAHHLPTKSAGYLIDKAGLKGKQIGGFKISDKHANFVINTGNGSPEDLHKMLEFIRSTIKEKYGVDLKEEVIIVNS